MNGNEVSLARAIRGPVTLITVGVLFALNNFTPYRFNQTWPVLLIVFGLLSLIRRGSEPVPAGPAMPQGPQPQTWNYPPRENVPGGYRQSTYQGTEAPQSGPVKGGFGTTAPRTDEPQNPTTGDPV
jgi:hypothetical protein